MLRKPSEAFMLPRHVSVMMASSSINDSFADGIVPVIRPTDDEIVAALETLGMTPETVSCAYCGDPCTEWDHLNPLTSGTMPTGYVTEIRNLVPCCSSCSKSKGNQNWREWIISDAPMSPRSRGIADITVRIARLDRYEEKFKPMRLDIESIVGEELWERHWRNRDAVLKAMNDSMAVSFEISRRLREHCERVGWTGIDEGKTGDASRHRPPLGANPARTVASERGNAKPTGDAVAGLVKGRFIPFLVRGKVSEEEVAKLQSLWYSNEVFGLSFPVLKRIEPSEDPSAAAKDHKGRNRYWVKPIYIRGERYLVCSQWYDRNRRSLERWLTHHGALDV